LARRSPDVETSKNGDQQHPLLEQQQTPHPPRANSNKV